jgi:hypothetical protein
MHTMLTPTNQKPGTQAECHVCGTLLQEPPYILMVVALNLQLSLCVSTTIAAGGPDSGHCPSDAEAQHQRAGLCL